MAAYLVRRIISIIPTLIVVGLIVFFVINLIPGDPAVVMLGPEASTEEIEALREKLNLNKPLHIQLGTWFANALRGDMGDSLYYQRPATSVLVERFEPTLLLIIMSIGIATIFGIPIGIFAAINRNKPVDQVLMVIALVGLSVPAFWLGLNLVLLFSIRYPIFPSSGYIPLIDGGIRSLTYLVLPATSLGLTRAAGIARMTRSSMLDVISSDYVRTARAKGLSEYAIIFKHAFRNAIIPVITQIGLSIAHLAGGAIVTERIFNIPGIGLLAFASISRRDYTMIQAHVLFVALAYIIINLFIDVLYKVFDPRIDYK